MINNNVTSFTYSGGTVSVPTDGLEVTSDINLEHLFMNRHFYSDDRYVPYTSVGVNDFIDSIANKSSNSRQYWVIGSTHDAGTSLNKVPNGSLDWNNFTTLMNHISDSYGRFGNDSVWVAPSQEVYEYLEVKQSAIVSEDLQGKTLTITVNTNSVPALLRQYSLSLKVDSDATIASITYGNGEFTGHSENLSTGLINLDWGTIFTGNDFTRVENMVTTAESSHIKVDIDNATSFANLLPAGSEKTGFLNRLVAIKAIGQTWQISFGPSVTPGAGIWNIYTSGDQGTPANNTLLGSLKNSDGNTTSTSVRVTQSFNSKVSSGMNTGNNSGIVPDAYLSTLLRIYNNGPKTATVHLAGLDSTKKYDLLIVGSMNIVANGNKTIGIYTVKGVSQELSIAQNTANGITFTNLSPETDGTLDINFTAKDTNFGYSALNTLQLSERIPNPPSIEIDTTTFRGIESGLVDVDYHLYDDNSDPINLSNYEYSFTGEFTSATPAVADGTHSGISNLVSSIDGVAHRFVWDSKNDIDGHQGTVYFRLKPQSSTLSGEYVLSSGVYVDFLDPVIPVAVPSSGTYNTAQSVVLTSEGSDLIKYSISSLPTNCSTGTLYTEPVPVTTSQTIYVRACDLAGNSSTAVFNYIISVVTENYIVPVPTAVIPRGGSHLIVNTIKAPILESANLIVSKTKSSLAISGISKIIETKNNLSSGMRGENIRTLQLFLIKQDKGPNAKSLASHGVTNIFGLLTKRALIEWQKANKILPATGNFGPKTKAKIKLLNL